MLDKLLATIQCAFYDVKIDVILDSHNVTEGSPPGDYCGITR